MAARRPRSLSLAILIALLSVHHSAGSANEPPLASRALSPPARAEWPFKGGTLSVDAQGWASHPSIAVGPDGHPYVAWSQHLSPPHWQKSSLYVKKWNGAAWKLLGGPLRRAGGAWNEAYDPEIAVVDGVPYVTWYEGGGYGWAEGGVRSSVFVAHWDGRAWAFDADGSANGALNTDLMAHDARNPSIAAINGTVYVAWVESLAIPNSSAMDNVVIVKHLDGGRWTQDGAPIAVGPPAPRSSSTWPSPMSAAYRTWPSPSGRRDRTARCMPSGWRAGRGSSSAPG
jgi:hypothetical protein